MTLNIPDPIDLGQLAMTPISLATYRQAPHAADGERTVLGFIIPPWQPAPRWSDDQRISFIESIWRGTPLTPYSFVAYNVLGYGNYLIDGVERMTALDAYVSDRLPVWGGYYSDASDRQRRLFDMTIWPSFAIKSSNDSLLLRKRGQAFLEEYRALVNRTSGATAPIWRDMASAPKDGTTILVLDADGDPAVVAYDPARDYYRDLRGYRVLSAQWTPIPAADL